MARVLNTTKGPMSEADLSRTLTFTENDNEFAVAIEYRLAGELVRRDAHVILKEASVVADALAASIG